MLEGIALALYGCAAAYLLAFAAWELVLLRHALRAAAIEPPRRNPAPVLDESLPSVTIQLPLFNEKWTAGGAIRSLAALDYPRDRLHVQVLDDSTDETAAIVDEAAAFHAARGLQVEVIRRASRSGAKAGALARGLESARGEFVAMFDADFRPRPSFLRDVFARRPFADPRVGFVQARWEARDRGRGAFAETLAVLIDRHFWLEKATRESLGLVNQFNGSAGVWRRRCIEDAGGWTGDTLTEDLDLSYRAALRGWRSVYEHALTVESELPADFLSFRRQQARWARGSSQCVRKLAGAIATSPWPLRHRAAELLGLSGYSVHLAFLLTVLTWPLVALTLPDLSLVAIQAVFSLTMFVGPLGFLLAQVRRGVSASAALPAVVGGVLVGTATATTNAAAVLRGYLTGSSGTFERTPKHGGDGSLRDYGLRVDRSAVVDAVFCAYSVASFVALWTASRGAWAMAMAFPTLVFSTALALQIQTAFGAREAEPIPQTIAEG